MVKRGETIKRGQMIAKAGQTGDVTSPQLHFEMRKGSTPVDPTQYLNGRAEHRARHASSIGPRFDLQGLIMRRGGRVPPIGGTPSRPARSWMNCQATRPERAPRVVDHSSASRSQRLGVDLDADSAST